jgi:predicted nucleotidyltransferase
MEQDIFLAQIKNRVLKEDNQASLILFGSKARGDYKKDSDWDLLVLTSKERTVELERKLRNSIYEIELEHLQPVSAIILNKLEWHDMQITPFYNNVTTEGKLL